MEKKVFEHLGYSPGEEWTMATILSEGCDGTVQELIELLSMLVQSYDASVKYVLTNPKPVGLGADKMVAWEKPVLDNCVELNQLCATLLLSCIALAEKHNISESMANRLLLEELTNLNLQDTHYFASNTLRTLFSLASHTRIYHYSFPNRGTNAINIENTIKGSPGAYLLRAGLELGTSMVVYHHTLSMKAVCKLVNLSTMLSALDKSDEESIQTEETKYRAVLDAIAEVAVTLDMVGYRYDTFIGITKTLAIDEDN